MSKLNANSSLELNPKKKLPKYIKEIVVVLLLTFGVWLWPIGIYLLYRWKLWPNWVRILLIIVMLLLTAYIFEKSSLFVRWEDSFSMTDNN